MVRIDDSNDNKTIGIGKERIDSTLSVCYLSINMRGTSMNTCKLLLKVITVIQHKKPPDIPI